MFDIGFWELVAIAIVTLLVVGPERLPKFTRDAGHIVGKIRHFIQTTKHELKKELELDKVNQLNEDINHIGHLMNQAPDRFISGDTPAAEDKKDKQLEK